MTAPRPSAPGGAHAFCPVLPAARPLSGWAALCPRELLWAGGLIVLLAAGGASGLGRTPWGGFALGVLAGCAAACLVLPRLPAGLAPPAADDPPAPPAPPAAGSASRHDPGSTEAQLRQAQKMEAIGRLAGGVAHDFNNLLTVINGYGEMLIEALPEGSPERDMAREVRKAGERAAGLTNQLLAFSRKQVLQPRLADLNAMVRDVEKMLRRLVREDIELRTTLCPDPLPVLVDYGQMEQVLLNLVINARDAMPKGGRLSITTGFSAPDAPHAGDSGVVRLDPHALLSVSDTGRGMDEATRARIFEPFFTTKEAGKGTGLGLATVYGIVRQSGGEIEVESAPDEGTTFRIALPLAPAGAAPPAEVPRPRRAAHGTETVLLAEDEDGVRALARQTLAAHGYEVLEARDGVEALVRGRQHRGPIHLVVTDVIMPHLGGAELVRQLRRRHPGVKALYMSGHSESVILPEGVGQTRATYLEKPFTADELARVVRDVLDHGDEDGAPDTDPAIELPGLGEPSANDSKCYY
jgi:signal transduction histidine kinase/CheY-like chemotaxis protein